MKKIFFLALMSVVCMFANADEISSDDYSLYLEDATAQVGTSVDVYVKIKYVKQVGAAQFKLKLPEGVTVEGFKGYDGTSATEAGDADSYYVLGGCQGLETVGVFTLSVPSDMNVGNYDMTITDFKMADSDAPATKYVGENVVSTLTVQKAAVIEEMPEGYALDVEPFVAVSSGNYGKMAVYYKAKTDLLTVEFDIKTPKGVMLMDDSYTTSFAFNSAAGNNNPTVTISEQDAATYKSCHIKIQGATVPPTNKKYIKANSEYTLLGYIPYYVDETWGEDYLLDEGIYEVEVRNIKMQDLTSTSKYYTGESLASVISGQPAAQEAILYGHYTSDVASAFSTALKNVAIADVTVATVDAGVKFVDVLVNEKGGNSYYTRTSSNFGTTVLPLDLTTDNVAELYRIVSMDAKSIVLTEAASVSANTPCIFKGTINVEGATPTLGVPSEQGLGQTTFKGTYSATEIAAGEGYYISSNGKFYNDGASVRPFRGYFDGAIAGVKSFSVFVNTANGLVDITNQLSDEAIYSLQGIRTQTAKKGVNIVGGKKVYIK